MGPAPTYPIPPNMEGTRDRNPYSRFNTMFNPRLIASDLAIGALPGPTGLIDRFTGNRIRGVSDRLFGATDARNQREYDAYMREMMRNDPGNQGALGRFFSGLRDRFSRGESSAPAPLPVMPAPQQAQPNQGAPAFRAPEVTRGTPSWMLSRFSSSPAMGRWSGESQQLMQQANLLNNPYQERNQRM